MATVDDTDPTLDESDELGPDDILELEDEDGNTLQLALLAMVEVDGKQYVMAAPLEEVQGQDDDDDGEDINIMLLAYTPDEDGGTYEDIEDQELHDRVMQVCMELMDSQD